MLMRVEESATENMRGGVILADYSVQEQLDTEIGEPLDRFGSVLIRLDFGSYESCSGLVTLHFTSHHDSATDEATT